MTPIQLEQVKAAATAKMNGPIGLEQQNTLAYFALAAIPVIEAAEEYRKPLKTWTQQEQRQNDLDAALAKLREG